MFSHVRIVWIGPDSGEQKTRIPLVASARESGNVTTKAAYPTFLHKYTRWWWWCGMITLCSYVAELTLIYSIRYFLISHRILLSIESSFGLSLYPFDLLTHRWWLVHTNTRRAICFVLRNPHASTKTHTHSRAQHAFEWIYMQKYARIFVFSYWCRMLWAVCLVSFSVLQFVTNIRDGSTRM